MNKHPWSSAEEEASYQAMLQRAEQEAHAAWRQGEEYRTRKARDEALIKALAPIPSPPTHEDIALSEPPPEISMDPPTLKCYSNPIASPQQTSTPPKGKSKAPKSQPHNPGSFDKNPGADGLLLIAILFFLWREKADKEILLALLYILLW